VPPKNQENWRAKNIYGWVYPWCPSCFALQLSGSIFWEVANEGGGLLLVDVLWLQDVLAS
jgi:hypothetical protein